MKNHAELGGQTLYSGDLDRKRIALITHFELKLKGKQKLQKIESILIMNHHFER